VSERRRRTGWWRWAVLAGAGLIIGAWLSAGYVAARYEARLGQMAREVAAVRTQLRRAEASLAARLDAYRGAVELLGDPGTRVIELRSRTAASAAEGRVIVHDTRGGHVFVTNLPPAPAGKTYALWAGDGATRRAAGIFQTDSAGRGHHAVAPLARPVTVLAITLEPAGGAPAPTGPEVLASR
jgi:anti-sigma-K factor RskA